MSSPPEVSCPELYGRCSLLTRGSGPLQRDAPTAEASTASQLVEEKLQSRHQISINALG